MNLFAQQNQEYDRTPETKFQERILIDQKVEEFLKNNGRIQKIPRGVSGAPSIKATRKQQVESHGGIKILMENAKTGFVQTIESYEVLRARGYVKEQVKQAIQSGAEYRGYLWRLRDK